jgi:hypothetical protein
MLFSKAMVTTILHFLCQISSKLKTTLRVLLFNYFYPNLINYWDRIFIKFRKHHYKTKVLYWEVNQY